MKSVAWFFGYVAIGLVLFLAWGFYIGTTPEGKANQAKRDLMERDRYPIQTCWESQARKSLTPGEARGIALICEGLEATFISKHGEKP